MKIDTLIPLLKNGWVAMDINTDWHWYRVKPKLNKEMQFWADKDGCYNNIDCFDIEPVKDWTKSLIRITKQKKVNKQFELADSYFVPPLSFSKDKKKSRQRKILRNVISVCLICAIIAISIYILR